MAELEDPYKVLGVARDAVETDIKKAYHRLAMKYHPDRNLGDREAEEQFKAAAAAYAVLSNPVKRWEYDQHGIIGRHRVAETPQTTEQSSTSIHGNGGSSSRKKRVMTIDDYVAEVNTLILKNKISHAINNYREALANSELSADKTIIQKLMAMKYGILNYYTRRIEQCVANNLRDDAASMYAKAQNFAGKDRDPCVLYTLEQMQGKLLEKTTRITI